MPVRYEEAFFDEHCDHFSYLRNLACAFRAEAWLAASKNDFHAAARIAIDILELANAFRRGGLVTDLFVGIAISGIAMDALRTLRTKLDYGTRRLVIDELHRLESERESFADVIARERDWKIAVGYEDKPCDFVSLEMDDPEECGLSEEEQGAIRQLLQQMADLSESDQRKMQSDQDYHILALMRLLAVDLALRDCHATSGSFPSNLSSLTPQPFAEVPLDPYPENPFIYRKISATSFDLTVLAPS